MKCLNAYICTPQISSGMLILALALALTCFKYSMAMTMKLKFSALALVLLTRSMALASSLAESVALKLLESKNVKKQKLKKVSQQCND